MDDGRHACYPIGRHPSPSHSARLFGSNQAIQASWTALASALPPQMTMTELLEFLYARTEAESDLVLNAVLQRTGAAVPAAAPQPKRIRVLTMHGAKGLDGSVVFIPSVEQGIIPTFKAIQAAGLVIGSGGSSTSL
jgi:superfamily I DNA/RNA helicase